MNYKYTLKLNLLLLSGLLLLSFLNFFLVKNFLILGNFNRVSLPLAILLGTIAIFVLFLCNIIPLLFGCVVINKIFIKLKKIHRNLLSVFVIFIINILFVSDKLKYYLGVKFIFHIAIIIATSIIYVLLYNNNIKNKPFIYSIVITTLAQIIPFLLISLY